MLLASMPKDQALLAARFGREGYGLDRLLADLQLTASASIHLASAQPRDHVKHHIRELWFQSLTQAHGRHEVANLIGPLLLVNSMAEMNDAGARELWTELARDRPIGALRNFLAALGLLRSDSQWSNGPPIDPISHGSEYFPSYDMFGRFEKVRFLLVDDQILLGYAKLLSVLLTGQVGPPFEPGSDSWEFEQGRIFLRAENSPETLLALLEAAASSPEDWAKLKVLGTGRFDVVLLDLRLFPDSGMHRASIDEIQFLERLAGIYRKVKTKGDWTLLAFEAAKDRLQGKSENPLQWALLPLLLCEADPSLPIVIFSSTHQRDISEALRSMPNVVTCFAKPLLSGYQEASVKQVRADLIEAIRRALQLHEKRAVWEHLIDLDWRRNPVFEIDIPDQKRRHYNSIGLPSRKGEDAGDRPPKISGAQLQERLSSYYREHLLWGRYIESVAAPFEFLEEALIPTEFLEDLTKEHVNLYFEDYIDWEHNPIAGALRLIRNKKTHGHARYGGMRQWQGWNERARLAATVLLFLVDFIRQECAEPLTQVSDAPGPWDEYCLKIVWEMVRQHDHVQQYLAGHGSLHPKTLTADENVEWEDATAYSLALACRNVARLYDVRGRSSWHALEALIRNRSREDHVLGKVLFWNRKRVQIEVPGGRVFRPIEHYYPAPPAAADHVLISLSDPQIESNTDWAVAWRCLPSFKR